MDASMTPPPVEDPGVAARADPARPRTRSERQQETRAALVESALRVFARDGFHGANLEVIANQAGYSKGAVYSNFDGKAELFFAVMDRNLAAVQRGGFDPFEPLVPAADTVHHGPDDLAELMRGLGLATLEFIATAARDEVLAPALTRRMETLLDVYRDLATTSPAADEPLDAEQVGVLLGAFDQGVAVLALAGIDAADAALLRTGLRRLLDPARALEAGPVEDDAGPRALHDRAFQRRLYDDGR
jgi:AcrR family transcriptional regulator